LIPALKHWKIYLLGQAFIAQTHRKTLTHLLQLSGGQARWIETLADYHVTIEYLKGAHNIVADAIARPPDLMVANTTTSMAKVEPE